MFKTQQKNGNGKHEANSLKLLALFLHLVWLVVFLFIIFLGPYTDKPLYDSAPTWLIKLANATGFSQVASVGERVRAFEALDVVALALTILGIVLAISALGGFILIRGAAMDAASDEARDTMLAWLENNRSELVGPEVISEIIQTDRIMTTLANEVKTRISEADEASIDDNEADSMAHAFDENKGGNA